MRFTDALPVDEALPRLASVLADGRAAVLVAPPGAGKTTRVPLALLDEPWVAGRRIILLEPRRLAARAAAARMAATLGEEVGGTVGLRVRLGSRIGPRTRIEVVTEGVFTRMILDDPALDNIACVIFDEFHERSLDADFGLALALDARDGLREDLRLVVMSATLDGARVASLLAGAEVIESLGRAFPVETRHLPRATTTRIEDAVAGAVRRALDEEQGSVLAFLPGAGEIRRTAERLADLAARGVLVAPLYGTLDAREQDAAIRPAAPGTRKVVLATSIAETSLTIEGVRVVIDSGLARVPVFEPDIGVTRLETVRVSRAAADQRRGRAGRTEPGICYRLWEEAATGALPAFATPEILAADLSGLLLDCAAWGVSDPARLAWLDSPPTPALTEARRLLSDLGALDRDGRLTEEGRAIRALPLPPRLARMVVDAAREGAAREAALVAAVMVERGLGGDGVDLDERLRRLAAERSPRAGEMRRLADNWARSARDAVGGPASGAPRPAGHFLALAFPDRVAKARGRPGEFVLANGRGAALDASERLARELVLAVGEIAGKASAARILLAAALSRAELEELFADRIETRAETGFDHAAAALRRRRLRRLGAIVLEEAPLKVEADAEAARALAGGIAALGLDRLPWTNALAQWRERVMFLARAEGAPWPDLSDEALAASIEDWLAPFLAGCTSLAQIGADILGQALHALLPYELIRRLEAEAPTHFDAPSGSRLPIDYGGQDAPALEVRVQELFGLDRHPTLAGGRVPITLRLLSPAHRPIQITRDLPGFWRGSWAEVKAQMKGRYPKHPWPDDPVAAQATSRAKPRGT